MLTTILLHQIQLSCVVSQSRFSVTGIQDKAIHRMFVIKILNMAGKSFSFCLARCLENCLCKSFQVCDSSKCELSSINKNEDGSALDTRSGCVYYDLDALDVSIIVRGVRGGWAEPPNRSNLSQTIYYKYPKSGAGLSSNSRSCSNMTDFWLHLGYSTKN